MASRLPTRKLGKNGPEVPALGLGLMGISIAYGVAPSDEERLALLDRSYELGCTNWDTSDLYGDSEVVIGKWLKKTGKRDDIFIASKFGYLLDDNGRAIGIDSSAKHCKEAFAKSAQRLGVDHIDLYYVHRVNPQTPIEETVRAMVELKEEGKIKYLGLSEVSSATLRRAHAIHPIDAVQMEYSPFVLDIEGQEGTNLLKTCRELGVAVVAYSPLGRGLLTGTIKSQADIAQEGDARSAIVPRFSEENLDANLLVVTKFAKVAERKGCRPSQLALAWLLKQGDDIIPIPGTKRIKYLEENLDAVKVQLSDEEAKEIRDLLQENPIRGGRYSDALLATTFGDTREE